MARQQDELRQRRIERLAEELANRLKRDGHVVEDVRALTVDVETWRAAGRRAGRTLGWSVRTAVSERADRVWLVDNRSDEEMPLPERRSQEIRLRQTLGRLKY